MAKTVFNNNMVAHVWAQRNQERGRSNNGQFYFKGPTIYSYRDSWPLAHYLKDGRLIVNTQNYSPTTARHGSYVRQAINYDRSNCLFVECVGIVKEAIYFDNNRDSEYGLKALLDSGQKYINHVVMLALDSAAKRRMAAKKQEDINGALYKVASVKAVYDALGIETPKSLNDATEKLTGDIETLLKSHKDELEAARIKAEKERADKQARLKELAEKCLATWLNGIDKLQIEGQGLLHCLNYTRNLDNAWLRVKGDNVETSQGASFPVEHAKKAFKAIRACKDHSIPFVDSENVLRLGHFKIDAIAANGDVKAGCHTVLWPAIEKVARELKIYP